VTLRFGIDLGGTKTEGVILAPEGRERLRERIPTDASGYASVLTGIERLYLRLVRAADGAPHTLGIGTPGALSRRTGLLRNSNTTCLNGMPVARDLRARLGRDLAIENDANCFALAEALAGAGRGHRVVFGVILGTGCGGGIVIDGRVHGGLQSIAGEWGHTVIDPAGPACYCGARGCVETFISGSGLENRYADRTGSRRPADGIVAAWRGGDPAAAATMDDFFARFQPDRGARSGRRGPRRRALQPRRAVRSRCRGGPSARLQRLARDADREAPAGRFRRCDRRCAGGCLGTLGCCGLYT